MVVKESRTRSKGTNHGQLLLCVAGLAGIAFCLKLVVTQLVCNEDGSYTIRLSTARCGNFRRRADPEEEEEPERLRYTYSDVLAEKVRRIEINAQDRDELSAASSRFDFADPRLQMVMKLVKFYFEPWLPMAGVKEGFGAPGRAWSVSKVREAAVTGTVMTCCIHVRVVEGRVYFRYGQVISLPWRLSRANGFVRFLHRTLEEYHLQHLRLEFLYNTCTGALSSTSSFFVEHGKRSNCLVMSNYRTDNDRDVLVPDVLDLEEPYMPSRTELEDASKVAWRDKVPKLVFRGATTNFVLQHFNWPSNPRVRLHRMTDAYADLLDARISRWSHTTPGVVWHMRRDGVDLAPMLNFTEKNAFKYELEMDGAVGSSRLCGLLSHDKVVVRQSSPFYKFFQPLLKRSRHFVEVKHSLEDLAEKVVYMQQHDSEMQQVVEDAHREIGWICRVDSRMLALAVVLVEYQGLLEDSHLVEKPEQMCQWGAAKEVATYARDEQPDCMDKHEAPILPQPGCPTVCSSFGLHPKDWYWLSSEDLSDPLTPTEDLSDPPAPTD